MALCSSLDACSANACSACAQLMRIVLRGLENVTFYFDNIYVNGKTFEAHSVALEQVLVRLELHGLTVRTSKCRFGFITINYLGFIVGNYEIKRQDDKISAILSTPCPEIFPWSHFILSEIYSKCFYHYCFSD